MYPRRRLQPWVFVSAGWLGPAVLAAINTLAQQRIRGGAFDVRAALFTSGDWFLYALLTPGVFLCARRWPLVRPLRAPRLFLHGGLSLVFCALWAGCGTILKVLLQPNAMTAGIATFATSWFFTTLPFGCAVYFSMVGVEHAIHYFLEARDQQLQVAQLSEQLTGARLAALQARLNPHFLFNSLNTVNVLIRDGATEAATRVIEQLSDVLRLTLGSARGDEVTLDEELTLVRQYLAVEMSRFSDRLRPEVGIDDEIHMAAVPSFAVQHLVENAIRHGIARRTAAGLVRIVAVRTGDMLQVSVTDDGPGISSDAESLAAHGLASTRERLRTLYGRNASLTVRRATTDGTAGTVAVLRVPYRVLPMAEALDAQR